jgi:hypothetical protein
LRRQGAFIKKQFTDKIQKGYPPAFASNSKPLAVFIDILKISTISAPYRFFQERTGIT